MYVVSVLGNFYRNPHLSATALFNSAAIPSSFAIGGDVAYFASQVGASIRAWQISTATFLGSVSVTPNTPLDVKLVGNLLIVAHTQLAVGGSPAQDRVSILNITTPASMSVVSGPLSLGGSSGVVSESFQCGIAKHPTENVVYITSTRTDRLAIRVVPVSFASDGSDMVVNTALEIPVTSLIVNNDPARSHQFRPVYRDGIMQLVFNDGATVCKLATIFVSDTDPLDISLVSVQTLPSPAFDGSYVHHASTPSGCLLLTTPSQVRLVGPSNCDPRFITDKVFMTPLCKEVDCGDSSAGPAFCAPDNPYTVVAAMDPCNMDQLCRNVARRAGTNVPCATLQVSSVVTNTSALTNNTPVPTQNVRTYMGCANQYGCEFWLTYQDATNSYAQRFVVDQNCVLRSPITGVAQSLANLPAPTNLGAVDTRYMHCYKGDAYLVTIAGALYKNPSGATATSIFSSGFTTTCFTIANDIVYFAGVSNIFVYTLTGTFLTSYAFITTTTVSGNQTLADSNFTLVVTSTAGFQISGKLDVVTTSGLQMCTYTSINATSFIGCNWISGPTSFTANDGSLVTKNTGTNTPPTAMDIKAIGEFLLVVYSFFGSGTANNDQLITFNISNPTALTVVAGPVTLGTSSGDANNAFQNSVTPHPTETIAYITATRNDRSAIRVNCVSFNGNGSGITISSFVDIVTTNLVTSIDGARYYQLRMTYRDGVIQFVFNDAPSLKLATVLVEDANPINVDLISVNTLPAAFNGFYLPFASTPSGCFLLTSPTTINLVSAASTEPQKYINTKPFNLPSSISAFINLASGVVTVDGSKRIVIPSIATLVSNFSDINESTITTTFNIFQPSRYMLIHLDVMISIIPPSAIDPNYFLTASTGGAAIDILNDSQAITVASVSNVYTFKLSGMLRAGPANPLVLTFSVAPAGLGNFAMAIEFLRFL